MQNESEKTGCFFEGYAKQFDNIYDTQVETGLTGWFNQHFRASMVIRFQKTFEYLVPMKGRSVLDIGCGSGRYIIPCLRRQASKVAAIDLSEQMLSIAKSTVKESGCCDSRVEFLCADFLVYSFEEQFDYAIVMGVMDYIAQPEEFLSRLESIVMRKAVISFPVAESIWTWQRRMRYRIRHCPLYFYSYKNLDELLKKIRLKSYTIERIQRDYFVTIER